MNWDDLRIFSAVANAGTLSGAARDLSLNHSTVYRRINALEESQSVRLFDRLERGYQLTSEGEEMKRVTDQLSAEIDTLERKLSGHDLKISGTVRITTTDTLLHGLLGPHLAQFQSNFPDIHLEIVLDSQHLSLTKREADVAIRPTDTPPDTLVGRRISDLGFGIYGSDRYLALHGNHSDLSSHNWIALDDSLSHLSAFKWMHENLDRPKITLTSNNFFGLLAGALSHMGLAPLPYFMGDKEPTLQRLGEIDRASELWVLTHADLKNAARIRAFLDFIYAALAEERDLLEGRYIRPKERKSVSRVAASKNR